MWLRVTDLLIGTAGSGRSCIWSLSPSSVNFECTERMSSGKSFELIGLLLTKDDTSAVVISSRFDFDTVSTIEGQVCALHAIF